MGAVMNKKTKLFFALFIYILLICLPLIVFIFLPMPPARQWWRDLSVVLGFTGLSLAGLQFLPTARLPLLSDVFDLDSLYRAHHILSILSVLLVFLHPLLLLVNNPYTLLLFNPLTAPWRAQAGLIGLAGLILIAISSVLRKELRLSYNAWHVLHDLLALVIAVFALLHLVKVNYYMSSPVMQMVWLIEALAWAGFIIYIRLLKPLQISRRPYIVDQVIPEIPDTWSLVLKPSGHDGLDFNAGQVAWLNIDTSPFTLHRNPFSISGSAHKKDELRFAIKNAGDFTAAIGKLRGGEIVYVDGPYGSFSLEDERAQKGLVLLAGGIGAAPVMSILHTLADARDKRPVFFFYGNYDEKNITFRQELEDLKKKLNLTLVHVLEVPPKKIAGESGFITRELLERVLPRDRSELLYFICGPLPMIHAMEAHLKSLAIPHRQISSEKYEMA